MAGTIINNKPTILVVDDTPNNIHLLATALMRYYNILVATTGEDALDLLKGDDKPDLVLLDVMMPGLDGYAVCRQIKNDPEIKNIPVIFVTASTDIIDQQRGFNLGAVDYITKPFEMSLVLSRIKVHVRLKQKTDLLEKLAFLDGLTDIPNRRALEDTFEIESSRAARNQSLLSVLMIDIDFFKAFNDCYGHGLGDECLRNVATILQSGLRRPGDYIGRYGGEEFMVILPECDNDGAYAIAENLRNEVVTLKIPHVRSTASDFVTISVGYVSRHVERDSSQDILKAADAALYRAKEDGRNRVCGYQCLS